ncbi:CRISPR-associated protein Cas1 [Acidimicrobium ferrooxidans DSM 10331]|uniref:CRISPR-associated endonuclease Cas1 n=1 Tax=Acidimicrobium ferrooxidans (strain DSM 10331 / JCM 15462 / NBRC 103882 / ICP) TaxID=525909 RepID=C7LYW4_ACIFD|nr:type I-E CRISPR-associated endonuclease Cas1e [Acidimicrobium ferrooxidans]ACU53922.1 CRISPR-associated protein Cas1 [Acidimicrobium ferrooxidans DSM 10331]
MTEGRVPLSGERVGIGELQPVSRRSSFVYLEHCVVHRDANAVVSVTESGTTYLPAAAVGTLLLGPGTRITHQAMLLLGESGVVVCWVGEGDTRLYAWAPSLFQSTRFLEAQARLVSNRQDRLRVARQMYQMRFPGEDVSKATMQRLRGMEGARIRRTYRHLASAFGIDWHGRHYDPNNSSAGDDVNRALSIANSVLYGVVHTAIVALGCSPGLGFVHTGHSLSFVYDVADLYKVELAIPVAFEAAAQRTGSLSSQVRRTMRERIHEAHLLERAVDDIRLLLGTPDADLGGEPGLVLFDDRIGEVPAGTDYSSDV